MNIKNFLSTDHKSCDNSFAEFENATYKGDVEGAKTALLKMTKEFEEHFGMEEKVLFPTFEAKSGMSCGPTEVMRREHEQLRFNLGMLQKAVDKGDKQQILGLCESFNILTQQHNSKEEQILYTMCEQVLSAESDEVIAKMQEVKNADRIPA
jgi:hemerythrin-like domain-containing protein